jgi:hypothetical protein
LCEEERIDADAGVEIVRKEAAIWFARPVRGGRSPRRGGNQPSTCLRIYQWWGWVVISQRLLCASFISKLQLMLNFTPQKIL